MAMRHLLKYKIQNLISIVGLSVGILCFSICLYCSRFISEVDSCFSNKDIEGNIIPIEDMANIYLEYTKMYGVRLDSIYIGLLSLTNENEVTYSLSLTFKTWD